MTFEAKDYRQGGKALQNENQNHGTLKECLITQSGRETENPMKGGNAYGIKPVLKQLMGA